MRFVFQLHLVFVTDFIELNPVPFVPMSLAKVSCADDTCCGCGHRKGQKERGKERFIDLIRLFQEPPFGLLIFSTVSLVTTSLI